MVVVVVYTAAAAVVAQVALEAVALRCQQEHFRLLLVAAALAAKAPWRHLRLALAPQAAEMVGSEQVVAVLVDQAVVAVVAAVAPKQEEQVTLLR